MKYTIILGFSIVLLSVFVIAQDDSELAVCVAVRDRLTSATEKCLAPGVFTKDDVNSFKNDGELMSEKAKHLAVCLFTEMGEFRHGKFNVTLIEERLREEIDFHPKADTLIKLTVAAATKANAEESDSDKAFVFTILQHAKNIMDLVKEIYCVG